MSTEKTNDLNNNTPKERIEGYVEVENAEERRVNDDRRAGVEPKKPCLCGEFEEDIYKELFDDVTGLRRREGLFKLATKQLKELFGAEEGGNRDKIDWYSLINSQEIEERFKNVYMAMANISFLSVANRASHDEGDRLLKEISAAVSEEMGDCFRHGGEQITCFMVCGKDEAESRMKRVRDKVVKMQNIANLKNYNLKPNVDLGIASLAEALSIYKEINDNKTGNRFDGQVALKGLENLWLKIAEKRAVINEARERIELLRARKENSEIILSELRKAVYDISDEELDELNDVISQEGEKDRWIRNYILRKENELIDAETNPYRKLEEETVLSYIYN